jgi:hypothetical protein
METPNTANSGLSSLAENVLKALKNERSALTVMSERFSEQMDALHSRKPDALEDATLAINQEVSSLERLRNQRERQLRLLGKLLLPEADTPTFGQIARTLGATGNLEDLSRQLSEVQGQIRSEAQEAARRCQRLEFALQYAITLGRRMLQAVRDFDETPPNRVYTAEGQATHTTTPRALVNRVG